jgi:hypothetical protein
LSLWRFYQVQWAQLEEALSSIFAVRGPLALAVEAAFRMKINGLAVWTSPVLAPVTFPPCAHRPRATDPSFNVLYPHKVLASMTAAAIR